MENVKDVVIADDGYSIPLYGIDNGSFYYIHIPAILCIVSSFTCAVIAIFLSFRRRGYRSFFRAWTKSERFVVYLAVCDGLFNVSHFTDHMHIVISREMVRPKELCEFYGFNLAVFITAQNLMVNVVAINAFMLIFFNNNLNFGRYDWRILLWTFGAPVLGSTTAGFAGQLGPNGTFCYFDGVNGVVANFVFTTVTLVFVLVMNTVLYILTWYRIHQQSEEVKHSLGKMSASMRASHHAARAMSMFVVAFFVQWWAMALYGIWIYVTFDVPQPVFHFVTTFSNIGGVLNLIVYVLIRKKQLFKGENVFSEITKPYTLTNNEHVTLSEVTKSGESVDSHRKPRVEHM